MKRRGKGGKKRNGLEEEHGGGGEVGGVEGRRNEPESI